MPLRTVIIIVVVLLFAGFLVYSFFPKSKDVSRYTPFNRWVGKTIKTERASVLMLNEDISRVYADYVIYEQDGVHELLIEAAPEKWILPAGTAVSIQKALLHDVPGVGISGYLVGTVGVPGTDAVKKFQFRIASHTSFYDFDKGKSIRYYDIVQPPWETVKDSTKYRTLPDHIY